MKISCNLGQSEQQRNFSISFKLMDVIWNKKCAALQALTFYSLGQPENVGSHFIQFGQKSFSSSKCPHSSWKGRLSKSTRKIWLILFRNRGWKITLKSWNCPHIWSTSAFFCSQTKRTACTFFGLRALCSSIYGQTSQTSMKTEIPVRPKTRALQMAPTL